LYVSVGKEATGRYKDQSIGDTPKPYLITVDGKPTWVVGVGCKDGGFYVFEADDIDAAVELAARIPAARLGGAVEVRPAEEYW